MDLKKHQKSLKPHKQDPRVENASQWELSLAINFRHQIIIINKNFHHTYMHVCMYMNVMIFMMSFLWYLLAGFVIFISCMRHVCYSVFSASDMGPYKTLCEMRIYLFLLDFSPIYLFIDVDDNLLPILSFHCDECSRFGRYLEPKPMNRKTGGWKTTTTIKVNGIESYFSTFFYDNGFLSINGLPATRCMHTCETQKGLQWRGPWHVMKREKNIITWPIFYDKTAMFICEPCNVILVSFAFKMRHIKASIQFQGWRRYESGRWFVIHASEFDIAFLTFCFLYMLRLKP